MSDIPEIETISPNVEGTKVRPKDESIYTDLVDQLCGEKLKVTELSCKIKEIHRLEEEQRLKVREISEERDRVYSIRDQLLEELSAKSVQCDEMALQLEVQLCSPCFDSSSE